MSKKMFNLSAKSVKAMCDGAKEKGAKEGRELAIAYGSYVRACVSYNKSLMSYDEWVEARKYVD